MGTRTPVPNRLGHDTPTRLDQSTLIQSLRNPAVYLPGTGGEQIDVIETHISHDAPYGRLEDIQQPAIENFTQLLAVVNEIPDRVALESLHAWTRDASTSGASLFERRRRHGFVRECHGDLHLRNIALVDGDVTLFDRLEFNDFAKRVRPIAGKFAEPSLLWA